MLPASGLKMGAGRGVYCCLILQRQQCPHVEDTECQILGVKIQVYFADWHLK